MEPNLATDLNKINVRSGYSSTIVVMTSLLSAVIGGGTVFGFALITKLGDAVSQPIVIDNSSTANGSSTIPQGFDFPDRGRMSTVTYAEPDPEVFKNLEFPEYGTKEATTLPETIALKLPVTLVSESYQQEFNNVLNSVLDVEIHLAEKVAKSMALVQEKAAAGRYLDMFEVMQQAKKDNEAGRVLSQKLLDQLTSFDTVTAQQSDVEILRLSNEISKNTKLYADVNIKLMDQNDGVLIGSIPSQAQLNEIQATATAIAKADADVALSIKNINAYFTQKSR